MKILEKVKKIFSRKSDKKIQLKESVCNLVIPNIEERLKCLENRPKNLSEKQWKQILNKILFAFSVKKTSVSLKSLAKIKMRKRKVEEGFRLFEVYFKDL